MSAWDWFDRIYLLNLARRPDRLKRSLERFARVGLNVVTVFPAIESSDVNGFRTTGHHGCALSHRAMCKQALRDGCQRVLILEDDVIFRDDIAEQLPLMQQSLEARRWFVFFLGATCEAVERCGGGLARPLRPKHAHAYALSRSGLYWFDRKMDDLFSVSAKPCFDAFMREDDAPRFLACPTLAVQESGQSDTEGVYRENIADYFACGDVGDFRRNCKELLKPTL